MDSKCMELVAAGWCTTKWLRFNQTIRNVTSGYLVIPLVVIQLGVSGLRKTRVVYLLDLLERKGEQGQYDLVCGVSLGDCANTNLWMLMSSSRLVSVVLVLCGVSPILRNGCGI